MWTRICIIVDKMQNERGMTWQSGMRLWFWLCNKIIHSLSSLVKIIRALCNVMMKTIYDSAPKEKKKGKKEGKKKNEEIVKVVITAARMTAASTFRSASHIFLFYFLSTFFFFGENAIIKIIVFTTLYETVTNTFDSFQSILCMDLFCCCFWISSFGFFRFSVVESSFFLSTPRFRSIYLFTFVRSVCLCVMLSLISNVIACVHERERVMEIAFWLLLLLAENVK